MARSLPDTCIDYLSVKIGFRLQIHLKKRFGRNLERFCDFIAYLNIGVIIRLNKENIFHLD